MHYTSEASRKGLEIFQFPSCLEHVLVFLVVEVYQGIIQRMREMSAHVIGLTDEVDDSQMCWHVALAALLDVKQDHSAVFEDDFMPDLRSQFLIANFAAKKYKGEEWNRIVTFLQEMCMEIWENTLPRLVNNDQGTRGDWDSNPESCIWNTCGIAFSASITEQPDSLGEWRRSILKGYGIS